jgi:PAS domain S-box-containing protein
MAGNSDTEEETMTNGCVHHKIQELERRIDRIRDLAAGDPAQVQQSLGAISEELSACLEEMKDETATREKMQATWQESKKQQQDWFAAAGWVTFAVDEAGVLASANDATELSDIIEHKQAEEQLHFAAQLPGAMGQSVMATDLSGTIVYWNHAAEVLYGWPADEVIGRNILEVTPPRDLREQAAEIKEQLRAGESWSGEFLIPRRDGTTFPALVTNSPIRDGQGNLIGIAGVVTDLTERKQAGETLREARDQLEVQVEERTVELAKANETLRAEIVERKQAEEALRESKQLLERTFASMLDAVFVIDADAVEIMDCNPAASKIFGYSREEMLGRTTTFLHVDEAALGEFRARLYPSIEEKGFLFLPDFVMKRKDGTVFPTEHIVMPLAGEKGKRIGWVSVVRDITECKRTEAELHRYTQRLETLREMDQAILASHSLGEIIQAALSHVGHLVPCHGMGVLLSDLQTHQVTIFEIDDSHESAPRPRTYFSWDLLQGAEDIAETLRSGNVHIVEDIQALPQPSLAGRFPHALGRRSLLAAPLLFDGELAGALILSADRPSAFAPEHVEAAGEVADLLAIALQNARLHEAAHRELAERRQVEEALSLYNRRLEILHEIDRAILAAWSPYEIAEMALEHIRELVPCVMAVIARLHRETLEAEVLADYLDGRVRSGSGRHHPVQLLGEELDALQRGEELEALQRGEVCCAEDVHLLGEPSPVVQRLQAEGLVSYVGLPLLSEGELIGFLYAGVDRPAAFDKGQVEIARELATSLAIAIRQAQLREQVQHHAADLEQRVAERTRELASLYDVTALTSQSLDLPTTLEQSLALVLDALRCDAGAIQVLDEAEQSGHTIIHGGFAPAHVAPLGRSMAEGGLSNWVVQFNQPLVVPDVVAADPRALRETGLEGTHAYLGVPMRAGGRVVGVVSVRDAADREFNAADVALLSSVADHLGVAVESDRLRQEAEQAVRSRERERLARELHDSVTQSLYSMVLFAGAARELVGTGETEGVQQHLLDLEDAAMQALREMRLMLYELRPPILEKVGLAAALQQRLDAVERRAALQARLLLVGEIKVAPAIEQELYGIALEALNNALRHSDATWVSVQISTAEGRLEMEVVDNGKGFEPVALAEKGGLGLLNMRQRAEKMGGTLTVVSAPGEGTTVRVSVRCGS